MRVVIIYTIDNNCLLNYINKEYIMKDFKKNSLVLLMEMYIINNDNYILLAKSLKMEWDIFSYRNYKLEIIKTSVEGKYIIHMQEKLINKNRIYTMNI